MFQIQVIFMQNKYCAGPKNGASVAVHQTHHMPHKIVLCSQVGVRPTALYGKHRDLLHFVTVG
jgi:hypothetical protein